MYGEIFNAKMDIWEKEMKVIDFILISGLVDSKSEIRRLINQKGI